MTCVFLFPMQQRTLNILPQKGEGDLRLGSKTVYEFPKSVSANHTANVIARSPFDFAQGRLRRRSNLVASKNAGKDCFAEFILSLSKGSQ